MTPKKTNILIAKEQVTLHRLEKFAQRNNIDLFNVKGSLQDRVKTIADSNGACPCLPKKRPYCPCKECIQEVKAKKECFCRVFIAKK